MTYSNHYQSQELSKRYLLVLIFLYSTAFGAFSQYSLSLGTKYVHAFGDRTIDFQNETFNLAPTHGFEVTVNNAYRFSNTRLQTDFRLGFRQLYFAGSSPNVSYSGQLNKLIGALGCRYFVREKLGFTGFIEVENNLELKDFDLGNGDLFRVCLSAEASYSLTDRLMANVLISRAMTPITEAYIIYNPQYQFRLGITYHLLK